MIMISTSKPKNVPVWKVTDITPMQLLKMQDKATILKAHAIVITKPVPFIQYGVKAWSFSAYNWDPFAPPPKPSLYTVSITGTHDLKKIVGLKVFCSCPRFKFHHDFALYSNGLSLLRKSIYRPPLITNPEYKIKGVVSDGHGGYAVCKHIAKCLMYIVGFKKYS